MVIAVICLSVCLPPRQSYILNNFISNSELHFHAHRPNYLLSPLIN